MSKVRVREGKKAFFLFWKIQQKFLKCFFSKKASHLRERERKKRVNGKWKWKTLWSLPDQTNISPRFGYIYTMYIWMLKCHLREREKERDDPLNHQLSLLLSNIVYIIFGSQNDHHDDDDTFEKNEVIYLNEFFRFSSISLSTKTKRTKKKFQPVSFSLLSFFFSSNHHHHHSNFIKFSNPISISNVHFFSSVYFSNTTLIQSISDTIVRV